MNEEFLTMAEAALALRRTERTLRAWISKHDTPVHRTAAGRVYIARADLAGLASAEGLPWAASLVTDTPNAEVTR